MGAEPAVIQRENDAGRVVLDGRAVEGSDRGTFLVIHERAGGARTSYPHGVGKLGVRLAKVDAVRVADAILAGAR